MLGMANELVIFRMTNEGDGTGKSRIPVTRVPRRSPIRLVSLFRKKLILAWNIFTYIYKNSSPTSTCEINSCTFVGPIYIKQIFQCMLIIYYFNVAQHFMEFISFVKHWGVDSLIVKKQNPLQKGFIIRLFIFKVPYLKKLT